MSTDRDIYRDAEALGVRPLTARSVLVSLLLGTHPPRLPVRALVAGAALFGMTAGSVRTALSRMVAAGDVSADEGRYELGAALVDRQRRQDHSLAGERRPWDGSWDLVMSTADRRSASDRAEARAALGAARLAPLRDGVWGRPANLGLDGVRLVHGEGWARGRIRFHEPPAIDRLWDLDAWTERADALQGAMHDVLPALEAGDRSALGRGFVVSAAVLRHFEADPLLPDELLPAGWPGTELRHRYEGYDLAYRALLGDFLRGS